MAFKTHDKYKYHEMGKIQCFSLNNCVKEKKLHYYKESGDVIGDCIHRPQSHKIRAYNVDYSASRSFVSSTVSSDATRFVPISHVL